MSAPKNAVGSHQHYTSDDQSEAIAFLDQLAGLAAEADHPPKRIETHGAIVFLTGDRAYKLKRAVRLAYLDFTTLAKREAACRNEIARNLPAAPEIYLGLEPVVRLTDGSLSIGGEGKVLDWVVVMHQFEQSALLDEQASTGALKPSLMLPLAEAIGSYHANAHVHTCNDGDERISRVVSQLVNSFLNAADILDLTGCGVSHPPSLMRSIASFICCACALGKGASGSATVTFI